MDADEVLHRDSNGVGDGEHESNGSAKLGTQAPRYHVIDAATLHQAVGRHSGHGDGGDGGDNVGEDEDGEPLEDARLPDHPGEPEEEHHPPDVEQAWDVNASTPTKLVHFPLLSISTIL